MDKFDTFLNFYGTAMLKSYVFHDFDYISGDFYVL